MEPTHDPRNPFEAPDAVSSDVVSSDVGSGRPRRAVVGGLLTVALLAAGATGVALASDNGTATPTPGSSGSASPGTGGGTGSQGDDERRGPGLRGFGHHRFGGPGLAMLGAIHGEVVVPKDGGGYQTLLMQRGKATQVSASSITVKSADGFTATYDVTGDTRVGAGSEGITSIDDNADVVVTARKTASGGTALRVLDLSNLPDLGSFRHDFDGDRDGRGPGGTGTPSPGTTTSSSVGI